MTSTDPSAAAAITGVVDRPRLYRILDAASVRVCVLQGPSGSGKTTLLRSWALQREPVERLLWISLERGLTTRHTFWRHVAASAVRRGGLTREVGAQVEEELGMTADPVRIAGELFAQAGRVVLVLDAYEHLGEIAPQIDEDLARLIAAVPGLRLMVTTRAQTALVDLELPGSGIVRVVTLGELALNADEVGALISAQAGIVDERLARSVVDATKGFPLTVRAVVLALSQLGRIPRLDSTEWQAVVAARLDALLPDPVVRRFVTDTSVPPYVDIELARELSGHEDTPAMLDALERDGFGRWIPYAQQRLVFQYVETIRDTFRTHAVADSERFRRSCVTTALWLLRNEEVVDQALRFAVDGQDYALADRVFVSLVITNPDAYTTDRFLSVLEQVPEPMLTAYPMLGFGFGLALMANPMRRLEAPRIFRIAVESESFPAYIEPAVDAFSHAAMRAIARRLALDWTASCAASLDTLPLVERIAPEQLARFGEHVGTILRQLSFSIWQGGRVEEALATANRSVALCTRPAPRNYSMVYVAAIGAVAGDVDSAGAVLAGVDWEVWPSELRQTSLNAPGLIAEAYSRMDAHDFPGAAEVLRDTQSYLRTNEHWPFLTTAWLLARHGLGQAHAEAERVTRELDAAAPPPGAGENMATEQLRAALASAWLTADQAGEARRAIEAGRADSPFLAPARLALLLAMDAADAALRRAPELLGLPGHTIRSRAETLTLAAVAALREAEPGLAWDWLSGAALASETYGPRLHIALLRAPDRRTLTEFVRARGATALSRYLDVRPGAEAPPAALSPRERIVLAALAEHEGTRAIAEALFVSPHTVKSQLRSVYRKLGVSSRRAALAAAHELGLLG